MSPHDREVVLSILLGLTMAFGSHAQAGKVYNGSSEKVRASSSCAGNK